MLKPYFEQLSELGAYPIDIDLNTYFRMSRGGRYLLLTAREGGTLVGFIGYVLTFTMHRLGLVAAIGDVLITSPSAETPLLGYKLLKESEDGLRRAGASFVQQTMMSPTDWSAYLRRLKYKRIGDIYEKVLA